MIDRYELAREAVRLVIDEGQDAWRIVNQIDDKADRAHVRYRINQALAAQRTDEMHLVLDGAVMCGRSAMLHTIPARAIKRPLTASLAQTQSRQRKLLEDRVICPECWSALRQKIEDQWRSSTE